MQSGPNTKKKLLAFPKLTKVSEIPSPQVIPELEVSTNLNKAGLVVLNKTLKTTHELHTRMRLLLEEIESLIET